MMVTTAATTARRTLILPVVACLLVARPAQAQLGYVDARPTQGTFVPNGVIAGDADATAVELNPGQIGFLGAPALAVAGSWWANSTPIPGRGGGLFFANPVLAGLYLGAALEGVRQPDAVAVPQLGYGKLVLAAAYRPVRGLSLGVSWGHIFGSIYDGLDTFDIGLGVRPWSWLALGAVVHDVGEPLVRAGTAFAPPLTLTRVWEMEAALRPLGTNQLELAAAAVVSERFGWDWWVSRFRASVLVARGWYLFGDLAFAPIDSHQAYSQHGEIRGTAGLTIDFEHASITGAVVASRTSESAGGAGVLRSSLERSPSAVPIAHIERVGLDGVDDDRAFLGVAVRLREAAFDPSVAAVLLETRGMKLGYGRVDELREAVALLRRQGKRVFAYVESPRTREMLLAAACDRIILHPAGSVELRGLSQTTVFWKGLLDRLGVRFDLVRIGEFKGAAEPLVRTGPSEPVQQNRDQLLDDVFGRLVRALAESRAAHGIDEARVRALVDQASFTPPAAAEAGLVDAVKDEIELGPWLRAEMGRSDLDIEAPDESPRRAWSWRPARVAVVLVDGTIMEGKSQPMPFEAGDLVGADTIVQALDEARRDPTVRAVVLRVNSPGGSAFASDLIARAVTGVRQAGKPVVVSMGDMAASGGYYIAAPADDVLASPSTLTGSIGVYAYKADGSELLDKLGLSAVTTKRGAHADADSMIRAWTPEELARVMEGIEHTYSRFLDVVEQGRGRRGLKRARIDEIGRGHVWTGAQAVPLLLVDHLGGVADAIARAAQAGGVPAGPLGVPALVVLPRPAGGLLQKLVGAATEESLRSPALFLPSPGKAAVRLMAPLLVGRSEGVMARLPYEIELQ